MARSINNPQNKKTLVEETGFNPGEKREYTNKEKFLNFMHYYKWWILLGIVIIVILGQIIWNALGIGVTKPDYSIACISGYGLTEEAKNRLETEFAKFGEDLNGDGTVKVTINTYVTGAPEDPDSQIYYSYAGDVLIQADIIDNVSCFFLMEDPEKVQRQYQILADENGNLPDDDDYSAEGRAFLWSSVPALDNMDLPDEIKVQVKDLSLGRRGYYDVSEIEYIEQYGIMWEKLFRENK